MHRVAIEISKSSVWLVSGSSSGGKVQLDHLLHRSLDGETTATAALAALAKAAGVKGSKCVAIVRRSDVEVRTAVLPSTELNELPDMVRFSATRLFANAGDTWPIDFLVLGQGTQVSDEGSVQQTKALVTALPPTVLNQLKNCCHAAGLELQSIYLAPVVAANAVMRSSSVDVNDTSAFLLADGYESGSELTICKSGKVHFLRNVRTPLRLGDNEVTTFSSEIKRTSMAAADSESPVEFDSVVALGVPSEQGDTLEGLIHKPVTVIPTDSLIKLDRLKDADQSLVEKSDWITLAMALAEPNTAKVDRPIDSREIDFLNPRRAIVVKRSVPQMIIAGSAAAAVLLGGVAWYFMSHWSLDSQIAELQAELERDKANVEKSGSVVTARDDIETFNDQSFNWLNELAYLSTKSLPADETVVESFDASVRELRGLRGASSAPTGYIRLATRVTQQSQGPELQQALIDSNHLVSNTSWINKPRTDIPRYAFLGLPAITVNQGSKTEWQAKALAKPIPIATDDKSTPDQAPAEGAAKESTPPANTAPAATPTENTTPANTPATPPSNPPPSNPVDTQPAVPAPNTTPSPNVVPPDTAPAPNATVPTAPSAQPITPQSEPTSTTTPVVVESEVQS